MDTTEKQDIDRHLITVHCKTYKAVLETLSGLSRDLAERKSKQIAFDREMFCYFLTILLDTLRQNPPLKRVNE